MVSIIREASRHRTVQPGLGPNYTGTKYTIWVLALADKEAS